MKRTLLFAFSATLLFAANAQTVIYSDDFESYAAGDMVAATNPTNWAIWAGGADQVISTAFANSGTNSIACIATAAAGGPGDLLLRLGDKTTGSYALPWNMYVPTGKGGYFNIQHIEIPAAGSFAAEVILQDGGAISGMAAGDSITGTYPQDAWFSVAMAFDLTAMTAVIMVDGNMVSSFAFNTLTDGAAGPNQLGSIDFFSYGGGTPTVGEFYVDDVVYVDMSTDISVGENSASNAVSIYPVPADNVLSIANGNGNGAASWQLIDLNGRVVMTAGHTVAAGTTDHVDISGLASGIYMMEIESGNMRERHRIVRN
ncbi:MAG: T9SS type A sorting domain-containing protein [Flavobacteriales bacterium]|nr:T9SS type A sorting domain-containing protein [Flavobacteriales bacterium]